MWASPLERFHEKIRQERSCWVWTGGHKAAGYGQFSVAGKKVIAHRWSYSTFVGPIPAGYEIDHKCQNRRCVRPDHLEAVTLRENRDRRKAAKTHCKHGHLYTDESTGWQRDRASYWSRVCLICHPNYTRHRGTTSPAHQVGGVLNG